MKAITIGTVAALTAFTVLMIGCSDSDSLNPHFKAMIDEHNGTQWYECRNGFLEEHSIWVSQNHHRVELVRNDADVPTRCDVDDIKVRVNETVATGVFSGSVR